MFDHEIKSLVNSKKILKSLIFIKGSILIECIIKDTEVGLRTERSLEVCEYMFALFLPWKPSSFCVQRTLYP